MPDTTAMGWRLDEKNPPRTIDVRAIEAGAGSGLNTLGFLARVLTGLVLEHGPIVVSNERLGQAALRQIIWQQTEEGVRLDVA